MHLETKFNEYRCEHHQRAMFLCAYRSGSRGLRGRKDISTHELDIIKRCCLASFSQAGEASNQGSLAHGQCTHFCFHFRFRIHYAPFHSIPLPFLFTFRSVPFRSVPFPCPFCSVPFPFTSPFRSVPVGSFRLRFRSIPLRSISISVSVIHWRGA